MNNRYINEIRNISSKYYYGDLHKTKMDQPYKVKKRPLPNYNIFMSNKSSRERDQIVRDKIDPFTASKNFSYNVGEHKYFDKNNPISRYGHRQYHDQNTHMSLRTPNYDGHIEAKEESIRRNLPTSYNWKLNTKDNRYQGTSKKDKRNFEELTIPRRIIRAINSARSLIMTKIRGSPFSKKINNTIEQRPRKEIDDQQNLNRFTVKNQQPIIHEPIQYRKKHHQEIYEDNYKFRPKFNNKDYIDNRSQPIQHKSKYNKNKTVGVLKPRKYGKKHIIGGKHQDTKNKTRLLVDELTTEIPYIDYREIHNYKLHNRY